MKCSSGTWLGNIYFEMHDGEDLNAEHLKVTRTMLVKTAVS